MKNMIAALLLLASVHMIAYVVHTPGEQLGWSGLSGGLMFLAITLIGERK